MASKYFAAEGAQIELIEDGGTSQTFYKSFNQTFSSGSSGQRIKKIKKKIKQKEYEIDDSNDEDGYEKVITKTEIKIVKKKKTGGKGRYQVAEGDEYEYEEIEEESGGGGAAAYQIFSGAYSLYLSGDVNIKHRTPKSATCMSWNGNKFKTFDGLLYNQPIYCAHTLVQDMIDGTFSVVLKACSIDAALGANCPFGLDVYLQNIKYSFDIKSRFLFPCFSFPMNDIYNFIYRWNNSSLHWSSRVTNTNANARHTRICLGP